MCKVVVFFFFLVKDKAEGDPRRRHCDSSKLPESRLLSGTSLKAAGEPVSLL